MALSTPFRPYLLPPGWRGRNGSRERLPRLAYGIAAWPRFRRLARPTARVWPAPRQWIPPGLGPIPVRVRLNSFR